MKKHLLIILTGLALIVPGYCQETASNAQVQTIIRELEAFRASEFPPDSVRSDYPLGRFTEADFARRNQFYQKTYRQLRAIDPASLSFDDQINVELLTFALREELHIYEYKEYLNPILSDEGFHTELGRMATAAYTSRNRLQYYLSVLRAIPGYVDQHLDLIRKGLSLGISQPRVALAGYESTYTSYIVDSAEQSVFWQPFRQKPGNIPDEEWKKLSGEARHLITQRVIPSFQKIKVFFENEYFPKTRTTLGAAQLPNGKNYYAAKVKYYTTTDISPDEVYAVGTREVARIKKEMQDVLTEIQFKGTISEFIAHLRSDPKFYPTSAEHLLKEASYIAKKVDGKLPLLFGKLPRQPYGVEPVPDYLAPTYTGGRYSPAPINSQRAGAYWVNTYNLKSRPLYNLEALTLHEAVPGHHLQIALTQELDHLPGFRRNLYINAFGEGWGLYSEYLGYELGLYTDPYSRFGRLTYEMWRACRLVIDVGLHDKNWTREQAVQYLADHTALSLHEVNTEINRYICWPGQALAYKMGEIAIKSLRQRAQEQLKEHFDVRSFHDLILSQGTVTMAILEQMVDRYIAQERQKQPAAGSK
jgi:uncharacterized protein (DUF885 family)